MKLRVLLFAVLIAFLAAPIYPTVMGCGGSGSAAPVDPAASETPDADFDGDGITNADDPDDDGDGVLDVDDVFPFDADESSDFDGDGIGDNEDTDDDNDGVEDDDDLDSQDADLGSPLDAVWVSQTEGAPGAEGTIDDPVDTINEALTIAAAEGLDVYVVEGTYAEDVELTDGISLFGGFSLLTDETRTRDAENNVTVIEGDATGLFSFEFEHEGPMDIPFTVLIDSSDSILDGFTVQEDDSAGNIMVYNSSATVRNCVVNGVDSGPRDMAMQIAIMVDGDSTKDQSVTISNNIVHMPDLDGAPDSKNIGVMAVPSNLGDGLLEVNVLDNTITSTGGSEMAIAIYAADNDSDPTSDESDGKLDIDLVAKRNEINMSGETDYAVAIGGGVLMEAHFLPPSEEMNNINSMNISENIISFDFPTAATDIAIGVEAGLVRESSDIYNNVISGNSEEAMLVSFLAIVAPTNYYNNTVSFESVTGGAVGFYLLMADNGPATNYSSSLGNINNNIIDLTVTGGACDAVVGGIEMLTEGSDTEETRSRLSPKEFYNNDIILNASCGDMATYVDYLAGGGMNFIATVEDLNAKTGFDATDPMLVGGNISEDPMFTNAATGDYTLQSGSPCVDTGYDLGEDWVDILGVSRPQGDAFDMGAYEQ